MKTTSKMTSLKTTPNPQESLGAATSPALTTKARGAARAKGFRTALRKSTWAMDVRGVGSIQVEDALESPMFGRALTRREMQVLSLAKTGRSSLQIAELLYVSKRTVDFHLANCYGKLGVANRIAAINEAVRRGEIAT